MGISEKLMYIANFKEGGLVERPQNLVLYIKFKNMPLEESEKLDKLYKSSWDCPGMQYINGTDKNKGILYINLVYKLLKDLENDGIR